MVHRRYQQTAEPNEEIRAMAGRPEKTSRSRSVVGPKTHPNYPTKESKAFSAIVLQLVPFSAQRHSASRSVLKTKLAICCSKISNLVSSKQYKSRLDVQITDYHGIFIGGSNSI